MITTESTEAQNLGAGFRYLDAERTERTVLSATMVEDSVDPQEDVVVVVTTTGTFTYKPWRLLSVYVFNGQRDFRPFA